MAQGVISYPMPACGLQTLRSNHLPRHSSKNARQPRRRLSCKARSDRSVDRRDVLLSGAAAVAAGFVTRQRDSALAVPIQPPDLGNCRPIQDDMPGMDCCPPYIRGTKIVDFKPPPVDPSRLRVRRPAHLLDKEYLEKYEAAVAKMKELPDDDPRSFFQQWRVHCAYCEGSYTQVGYPKQELSIHNCWLFFPWHRLYLYFHERILGNLIGDDSFALPFWNWDAPAGMYLPKIYTNKLSPLYDKKRNPMHQPPVTVDLDYDGKDKLATRDQLIESNLVAMYNQMVSGAKKPQLFFGKPYCQGDKANPGAGTIEVRSHNLVHDWTGDPNISGGEDMGILATAANDPVFFAHHGNVDRMWYIWNRLSPRNTNLCDPNWLNASFLFYDERRRLVRARVRDCLDTAWLGYTYQPVSLPWLWIANARPSVTTPRSGGPAVERPLPVRFPAALDNETLRVEVRRNKTSRSAREKEEEEEVLVIRGIRVADHRRFVKFDVFVNAPPGPGGADSTAAECAGSVGLTPHRMMGGSLETSATFGITDLLEDIGADRDETIVVSIVPRAGGDTVTIGSVSVEYIN